MKYDLIYNVRLRVVLDMHEPGGVVPFHKLADAINEETSVLLDNAALSDVVQDSLSEEFELLDIEVLDTRMTAFSGGHNHDETKEDF